MSDFDVGLSRLLTWAFRLFNKNKFVLIHKAKINIITLPHTYTLEMSHVKHGGVKKYSDYIQYVQQSNTLNSIVKDIIKPYPLLEDKISSLLCFCQSLPYISDGTPPSGCIDYVKYPTETLANFGGDCEDKAILFISMMNELKSILSDIYTFDLALCILTTNKESKAKHPRFGCHAVAGITNLLYEDANPDMNINFSGVNFDAWGQQYYSCDCTAIRPEVGYLNAGYHEHGKQIFIGL